METRCQLSKYLELVKLRASGELMTTATWIRQFVQSHPDYKQDSVVSQRINYDLAVAAHKLTSGELHVPELLGTLCGC